MAANKDTELKKQVRQIVGHTKINKIDLKAYEKAFGNKYIMIDALNTSKEYLVIEDGELIVRNF
jgi:hypothetical protein